MNKDVRNLSKLVNPDLALDELLLTLHSHGANPTEAIQVLKAVKGMSLKESKLVVSQSPLWSVETKIANELHQELISTLSNEKIN